MLTSLKLIFRTEIFKHIFKLNVITFLIECLIDLINLFFTFKYTELMLIQNNVKYYLFNNFNLI